MLPMNGWGDPYAGDISWQDLKVGDKAKAKSPLPIYHGVAGEVIAIDDRDGSYTLKYPDGSTMAYDGDMLVKIEQ